MDSTHEWMDLMPHSPWNIGGPITKRESINGFVGAPL